jgi:hypothetical protein
MVPIGKTALALVLLALTLALAGCGEDAARTSTAPSSSADASSTAGADLSVIGCATEDPSDVGDLTGAWAGDDSGVYYIRQVGDCLWWFGTELVDIEPGLTGQNGFANVASGHVAGTRIDVEWADVPVGDILGGGGLTLVYDDDDDQLVITERRGESAPPFGATTFTRIEPEATPDGSPSPPASP